MKLNKQALNYALNLVKLGKYDIDTPWEGGPDNTLENNYIEKYGWSEYGKWYLGINEDANEETKAYYRFPYSKDFQKVYYRGVIAAKQRAAQQGYQDIVKACDDILEAIRKKEEKEQSQLGIPIEFMAKSDKWLLVLPEGEFYSDRYGKFKVTKEDLQEMAAWAKEHGKLVVDYNHQSLSDDPEKAKAAGWIYDVKVDIIGESDVTGEAGKKFVGKYGLFIKVEWTDEAKEKIQSGQFKYLSPTFSLRLLDPVEGKRRPALLAVALTNRPFLQGLNGEVKLYQKEVNDMEQVKELFGVNTLEEVKELVNKLEGEKKELEEKVKTLTQEKEEVEKKLTQLEGQLVDMQIEKLIYEGKILPRQKDFAKELYQKDPELFKNWLDTQEGLDLGRQSKEGENEVVTKEFIIEQVHALADKEKIELSEAMERVFNEHPDWEKIYYNSN